MNPSTAQHRLLKDILWNLILKTNQNFCCKCGCEMTRADFSIEHVEPWLDSDDPVRLFFDMNNISFSHLVCNMASRRPPSHKVQDREDYYRKVREKDAERKRKAYSPDKRRAKYISKGY